MYQNLSPELFLATAGMHLILSMMLARGAYIVTRDLIRLAYRLTAPPGPRIVYMRAKRKRLARR